MLIDAHVHLWQIGRGDYGWLTPDLAIYRDFSVQDLRHAAPEVTGVVLVQAAPTPAETDFLLGLAQMSGGLVRGVVGWVDLAAPDAASQVMVRAATPLLCALRPMLQDIADTDWLLRPAVQPGLAAMAAHGLVFDALVTPRHLDMLPSLAARHPDLRVVIDHGAKPDIATGAFQPWADRMTRLAQETPWPCKLSGLVTEAGPDWTVATLRPYVDHLLASFGPARLIGGSDWPVVTLAASHARWLAAARALVPPAAHTAVFATNAAAFYGLI